MLQPSKVVRTVSVTHEQPTLHKSKRPSFGNPIKNSGGVLFYRDLEIADPKWLVDQMIIEGGHHIFWGKTGMKKSFLVMDMALRLVNGMDYYGRAITPCEVVYVVGEGHAEFRKRQDAWLRYHKKKRKLISVMDPLYFKEPERFKAFIDGVKELGAALVIIDTLSDAGSGVKLMDNDEYNTFIKPLRKAINMEAGAATLFVHHSGHGADRETGASTIRNDAEASFRVGKVNGLTTLARRKIRGADDSDQDDFLFLRSVKVGSTLVLDEADKESIALSKKKDAEKAESKRTRVGRKEPSAKVKVEASLLKALPSDVSVKELVDATGENEKTVRNTLTVLKAENAATNTNGRWKAVVK